jgi:hypothetical protein
MISFGDMMHRANVEIYNFLGVQGAVTENAMAEKKRQCKAGLES